MDKPMNQRRYDLDWLRIFAFGLLIFYHLGMYYVSWGWHVKSPYSGEFLEPAMRLLNPWRLSILFIISGVAVSFAAEKMGKGAFAGSRFGRLMVPLLFGAFFIVPPQTYFELLSDGIIEPGYWTFLEGYIDFNQRWEVITPTYNHLWYVAYMLIYTMLLIPFLGVIKSIKAGPRMRRLLASPLVLVLPVLPFLIYRFTTDIEFPETHDFRNDWGAHLRYFSYFLVGVLIAKSGTFWQSMARYRKLSLALALATGAFLTIIWANWASFDAEGAIVLGARILRIFFIWWVICALFGLAQQYLNRPGKRLSYLTEAVFPYYILHQTIIVVAGVFLSSFRLGAVPEFLLLSGVTISGCALLHEYVIRRVALLRPLFGLKPLQKSVPDLPVSEQLA